MPTLEDRISESLAAHVHPAISVFAEQLANAEGAHAALFYGSNLRTGDLDGVLDFYLLLPGKQRDRIWPRVSYHEREIDGTPLRAKAAAMSLETFHEAASGRLRDTTIWARFVQPSALVWQRGFEARAQVVEALTEAAKTAARFAAALGPEQGAENDFWRALFQQTYKAEFRVEKPGREDSILTLNRAHFDGLLPAAWTAANIDFEIDSKLLKPMMERSAKVLVKRQWHRCRRWGKPLNILRLLKASTTFDGAGRYAAWKVQRHTGVPIKVTPWREKHPILAAPGVLFQVWLARRKG